MNLRTTTCLLGATLFAAACGPSPSGSDASSGTMDVVSTPDAAVTDAPATDASPACALSDAGDATGYYVPAGYVLTPFLSATPVHDFPQADMVLEACKHYEAVLETDVGRIVFDFYDTQAPITVNSFVFLARNHYFDGIAFHRVIDGFVAQGGDPLTLMDNRAVWGTGDPGYSFGLEIDPSLTYDGAGVVGMARTSDPNSNGSQFYITLAATHSLDGMYTIFARVTEGLDVLPMLARGEPPMTPTRMTRVYIVERARM